MELSGTLSNPSLSQELVKLARIGQLPASGKSVFLTPLPSRSARTVADTVHDILRRAATSMRVADIHANCEAELGRSIPRSTVKDSLSEHTNSSQPRFVRLALGLYRLAS